MLNFWYDLTLDRPAKKKKWLDAIDKAMIVAEGNRAIASKLLDLEPATLKNLINYNECLKTRWGHSMRGRPKNSPRSSFYMEPFDKDVHERGIVTTGFDLETLKRLAVVSKSRLEIFIQQEITTIRTSFRRRRSIPEPEQNGGREDQI